MSEVSGIFFFLEPIFPKEKNVSTIVFSLLIPFFCIRREERGRKREREREEGRERRERKRKEEKEREKRREGRGRVLHLSSNFSSFLSPSGQEKGGE